MPDGWADYQTG